MGMPRFYFHVHDGASHFKDVEGVSLPDAEAAWYQAVRSARELIRRDLKQESDCPRYVEIEDELGKAVNKLRFEEVAGVVW